MKRAAVVACAVLLLAACGGGGGNPQADQVKAAYTGFFTTKTSLDAHVALVQDGEKYRSVIQSFLSNPLAKGVTATVSNVKFVPSVGPAMAKVTYSVKITLLSLTNQTGYAVRQGGKWKVASATLCALVALTGTTPAACK